MHRHKKSGTALLLFRFTGSGIAFVLEQATPKPTPICTITHTPIYGVHGYGYTYPEDIKCRNVLSTFEFTRFVKPKHSAYETPHKFTKFIGDPVFDAFIMSCNRPPYRHNPKAWTHYGCKGTNLFRIEQMKIAFGTIFGHTS